MSQPIKNNSKLLYLQARQLFEEAKQKFEDGTIQSEPRLIEAVFQAFEKFFTSMGKPNFVPRYAPEQGPPWSKDYNSMMLEIKKDLELLFQELEILGKSLYSDFNHNIVQYDIIDKQFQLIMDKMRDLEIYTGIGEPGVKIGRDDFFSKDKIDYSRIAGTPLEVVDGAVTLPIVNRKNVAKDAKITIIPGNRREDGFIIGTESNGFPGNNTEIQSVTDEVLTNQNYMPIFLGDSDNHGNYAAMIDGNPNTWFEFEKVNVREHDRIRVAKNLGWDYQVYGNQTVTWAEDPENGVLKLHVQITLDKEEIINQINVHMYTPPNYGAKPAIVKNILVSDGKEPPRSILPESKTDDQYSFHFEPVRAKVISILFEQPYKYLTDIGHIFYEKKMQVEDNSEYAMDMATKKHVNAPRVEGPLVSLEDLGIQVNVSESNVEATYPQVRAGERNASSMGEIIGRLLNSLDSESVDMGIEKFEGFRWCIGIRDIEIFSCEYAPEGELVTHPFYFDQPLDKISLDVRENIPKAFAGNDAMKYDWLHYYVSIDDGATWHPITPMSHEVISEDQPPKIYTVRTIENSNQQLEDKTAYLESEYPVYSIRLKIVGRRPDLSGPQTFSLMTGTENNFHQSSPIVNSYVLNIQSVVEAADSEESNTMASGVSDLPNKPDTGFPSDPLEPGEWEEPEKPEEPGEVKPPISIKITNKKQEWCVDEDLVLKGIAQSNSSLKHVEFYINGSLKGKVDLSGNYDEFEWTIPANTLNEETITIVAKVYDGFDTAVDTDIINIINCDGLPDENRPSEDKEKVLSIVVDRKPDELCECDPLIFYGTVEGPYTISSIEFKINGTAIDPNNLGNPPIDNPCGAGTLQAENNTLIAPMNYKSPKEMTDEDLLAIEDFGEWLDAFEEREGCATCKKKRKQKQLFRMQATPIRLMNTGDERSFYVEIPYWKLRELGADIGKQMEVEIIAKDMANDTVTSSFKFMVKDCDTPQTDEDGNPRVRDCWILESVEVHYYSYETKGIEVIQIPANALPYAEINNGAGVGVTVGWDRYAKAPVIMQTSGFDDSGYTFQIHAVGIHYLNEYNQPETIWAESLGNHSDGILNVEKMLGEPSKDTSWLSDIENGDYSTAPGFSKINDFATFVMSNEWIANACPLNVSHFNPEEHKREEVPCEADSGCNELTHIIFQVYDEIDDRLKFYKIDISQTRKDVYDLKTKNGDIKVAVGWVKYFNGPVIQLMEATGTDNLLLTALGVIYINQCGESQTVWSSDLRYKTVGTQNIEFAIGQKKEISDLYWVINGTVNYDDATYLGKQGDMAAFLMPVAFTGSMCEPEKTIDDIIGIDPVSPPDMPSIDFIEAPYTICFEEPSLSVQALAYDAIQLTEIEYSIEHNGVAVMGPFVEHVTTSQYTIDFNIGLNDVVIGDSIRLIAKAKNVFGNEVEEYWSIIVESCDEEPPTISLDTSLLPVAGGKYCYNDLVDGNKLPVELQITDDTYLSSWSLEHEGVTYRSESYTIDDEPVSDTGVVKVDIPVQIPERQEEVVGGKADIVFIFDTSGSMNDEINNAKNNIEAFKEALVQQNIDAHIGVVDSHPTAINLDLGMVPASEFSIEHIQINGGTWEGLKWRQITDSEQGGMKYFSQFREDALRFFIMVTDTYITEPLPDDLVDQMNANNIRVSVVYNVGITNEPDYETIASRTGGKIYDINAPDFGAQMLELANDIAKETKNWIPDKTYTFTAKATDISGKETTKQVDITLTDCSHNA